MENSQVIRAARSINDLERRKKKEPASRQFGLGRLIIATNVIGVIVAVIVATRGNAIIAAMLIGILATFLLPFIVLLTICGVGLKEYFFGRKHLPLVSKQNAPKVPKSPFDD